MTAHLDSAVLSSLVPTAESRLPQMLADLERVISVETPSHDLAAVAAGAADFAALIAERLGATPETVVVDGVTHLRLRFGSAPVRVAVLCHQDTVWPVGTLERIPFSHEDGVIRGPGSFDMLTGAIMAIHAIAMLQEHGGPEALDGLTLLVTGDEEVGSLTGSDFLRAESAGARAAFVLEASAGEAGALKLARKGTSIYTLVIHGHAAHAGLEPEKGVNAGLELAHLLQQVATLGDPALGTTVTPTLLSGGTTTNTVPAQAQFDVDVRAKSLAEQERVDAAIRALTPTVEGARIEVRGGINRPPMERSASEGLFARAGELAAELGIDAPVGVEVGGASDGNFTAGDGIPTLDGLGAVGDGAHAEHEHALSAHIAPRTALLAALLADQLAD
ncbi:MULTISPECIES: M20/M25/M40 family metallo-hydrolase [Brevibacterium]|jgi:glutamate carboxypeptidase|uniref:M20 family metallopeptidase n=1 Tax=Brevibacterium salitolerans TaxID=1403566 RepID=A0ABN2WP87_9MICO|nr:M20/M25/M40 family metallo-hydrolase [Brevibacterium sp.]